MIKIMIIDAALRIVETGFSTIYGACDWIKSHYSHRDWIESELSLCECEVDKDGNITEILDQFNPFV